MGIFQGNHKPLTRLQKLQSYLQITQIHLQSFEVHHRPKESLTLSFQVKYRPQ
jgi:hypothetical protein